MTWMSDLQIGKALLAKATAGKASVPFLSVSGSGFVRVFVGVCSSHMCNLFVSAKRNTSCIIFVDKIDAIGEARGKGADFGRNDEQESTLSQLLVEMDGFGMQEHVVVLMGTNRPNVLDPALMRPGRFDCHITIDCPELAGHKGILPIRLSAKLHNVSVLAQKLVVLMHGFLGTDITNVCNKAARHTACKSSETMEEVNFKSAIEHIIAGLERKSRVLSVEEKRTVRTTRPGIRSVGGSWSMRTRC